MEQKTPTPVQKPALSCTWQPPNPPPAPSLVLTFRLQNTHYLLHRSRVSVSYTGENSVLCSSSPFTTANRFLTVLFSSVCAVPGGVLVAPYSNTSSSTNAISRLAKRGPGQRNHHTATHENFRIRDSFSAAAMRVAAV